MGKIDRFGSCSCRVQFVSAALAVLVSACGGSGSDEPPPPPPGISVSSTSIDAEAGGGSVSVNVSNSGGGTLNWTAAIPAGVDWARIASGASGANAGAVQIEIDANSGAAREFDLTVSASGASSRTVTVRQPEAPAMLELSADSLALEGIGGSVRLQVSNAGYATMQWTASLPDDVDWAYIESGAEGTDAGEVVIRSALNGGEDRETELTVTAADAANSPQSVALSQEWFAASACTYPEARTEVFDLMETYYYFNDEPEMRARYDTVDVEDQSSLNNLLDQLRWKPETHDRGFTYWTSTEQTEMLFAGEAYIFGFRGIVIVDAADLEPLYYQVLDVFAGSPADNAGLERGDEIIGLNGKSLEDLTFDQIFEEFGPNEEGFEVSFEVENKQSGEQRTFSIAKALVEIPTVPEEHVNIFDTAAGKVGYVHFRTFFGDANIRLLQEFAEFKTAGVRSLIVDLRYNGGGSVPIAHGLATLIGGPELFSGPTRNVLARTVHNEVISGLYDNTAYFGCGVYGASELVARCENESSLPNLENVVFITGRGSASASELVITALQPYENVALVGANTYGKPVGQYGLSFCLSDPGNFSSRLADLWAVTFATVNAEGFEEYYEGIPVTQGCDIPEDFARQLGDPEEALIAAALRYLETGSCGAAASSRAAPPGAIMQPGSPQDPVTQFLGH